MQEPCCQKRLLTTVMSFSKLLLSTLAAALFASLGFAADSPPPTGEQILRMVRMSQALQDLKHLKGKLRNDDTGQEFPFDLTMSDNVIRFVFPDPPKEIINLDLRENGTKLTRVGAGGKVEMPLALYSQPVRTTA